MITKEEARKQWIKALRSGKYKQTRGALHNLGGYCCLGVACDLFADQLNIKRSIEEGDSGEYFDGRGGSLPDSLVDLLDLISRNGAGYSGNCLTELNDRAELSFNEIANELETGEYWRDRYDM